MTEEATLYGIEHSNRKMEDCWTKNTFNSSFPVALANYMRDQGIKANYIELGSNLKTKVTKIDIDKVFNANGRPSSELCFNFEDRYAPYQQYAYDQIDGIDLVVKDVEGNYLTPLEIKLTVIPDDPSKDKPPEEWGSELVIRPATTSYCCLGMFDACKSRKGEMREIFEPVCQEVEKWDSSIEMLGMIDDFAACMNKFESSFLKNQRPFIMQPIWKTEGQSPILAEDALDLFVWSDFAFTRIFLEDIVNSGTNFERKEKGKISRRMRCAIRTVRCLYELSVIGRVKLEDIYRKMAYNVQTDKEFSANGLETNHYMRCPELLKPRIKRSDLSKIIINGGENLLKPERRFDQSIYFTMSKWALDENLKK
jgi:hypothetical protein